MEGEQGMEEVPGEGDPAAEGEEEMGEGEEEVAEGEGDMDTMEDDAVPADSEGEEEAPTGDEVVEGMQKETKEDSQTDKSKKKPKKPEAGEKSLKCLACGKSGCSCGKKTISGTTKVPLKNIPKGNSIPPSEWKPGVGAKRITDRERSTLSEAAALAGTLSVSKDPFDDEMRMSSFHFHKLLKAISDEPPTVTAARKKPEVEGSKAIAGDLEWLKEEEKEKEHKKKFLDTCTKASEFFGFIAREKAFGENHRKAAGFWEKELKALLDSKDMDGMGGEMPADDLSGEVKDAADSKSFEDSLKKTFLDQQKAMDALTARFAKLTV